MIDSKRMKELVDVYEPLQGDSEFLRDVFLTLSYAKKRREEEEANGSTTV